MELLWMSWGGLNLAYRLMPRDIWHGFDQQAYLVPRWGPAAQNPVFHIPLARVMVALIDWVLQIYSTWAKFP